MAKKKVVGGGGERSGSRVRDARSTGLFLLGALGASFWIVGLVDLGLLWYPLNFDQTAWEFATLSRTLDSVPMSGLGLGLLTFAVVSHPEAGPTWVRTLSVLFVLAAVAFVAMGLLYATAVPEVLQGTAPQNIASVNKAIVKNGLEAVVYTVVFGWVGARLWRSVGTG